MLASAERGQMWKVMVDGRSRSGVSGVEKNGLSRQHRELDRILAS